MPRSCLGIFEVSDTVARLGTIMSPQSYKAVIGPAIPHKMPLGAHFKDILKARAILGQFGRGSLETNTTPTQNQAQVGF